MAALFPHEDCINPLYEVERQAHLAKIQLLMAMRALAAQKVLLLPDLLLVERNALLALATDPLTHIHVFPTAVTPEILRTLEGIQSVTGSRVAAEIVDATFEQLQAMRDVMLVQREDYYQQRTQYARMQDEIYVRKEGIDPPNYYQEMLLSLKNGFDKRFMPIFNGRILTAMQQLMATNMVLAGKELTAPSNPANINASANSIQHLTPVFKGA